MLLHSAFYPQSEGLKWAPHGALCTILHDHFHGSGTSKHAHTHTKKKPCKASESCYPEPFDLDSTGQHINLCVSPPVFFSTWSLWLESRIKGLYASVCLPLIYTCCWNSHRALQISFCLLPLAPVCHLLLVFLKSLHDTHRETAIKKQGEDGRLEKRDPWVVSSDSSS